VRGTLPALLACAASACVQVSWSRESHDAPLPAAADAGFTRGETDLAECLELLGAPLWVWEHDPGGGAGGAALAYGWFDERNLGFRASVEVYRGASASVDYDQIDQRMRGLVLFFDADWKLTAWREGLLRDLTREVRRPPPPPEEA
jgi:hypothetical protein